MKKETKFTKTKRLSDIRNECSAEVSLPDYNPDVRKVLLVSADPHPVSIFAASDGLECSGTVNFNVVYIDFDGQVNTAPFNGDYNFKVKYDTESYKSAVLEPSVLNVSLRLMSPRKIAAKASLENRLTVISEDYLFTEGDALAEELDPQLDTVTVRSSTAVISQPQEREYAEVLTRFEGKTTDEVHILHTQVTPVVLSLDPCDEGFDLTGKLTVSALIKTDEVPLYKLEKSIDVSEKIAMPDMINGAPRAVIDIASVTSSVNGDASGVDLVLNVITETQLLCQGNESFDLVTDAYLCTADLDNVYNDITLCEYLDRVKHRGEIDEKVSLGEYDAGKLREVVYCEATPRVDTVNVEGTTVAISGELLVSCIATEVKDDGSAEFVPLKFNIKFAENVNINSQIGQNSRVNVTTLPVSCSVTVDSANAYVKAIIDFEIELSEDKEHQILSQSDISSGSSYTPNPSRITVYYPTKGDTLYKVAKAYHTTKERLISDNPAVKETSISDDFSAKINHLIIT